MSQRRIAASRAFDPERLEGSEAGFRWRSQSPCLCGWTLKPLAPKGDKHSKADIESARTLIRRYEHRTHLSCLFLCSLLLDFVQLGHQCCCLILVIIRIVIADSGKRSRSVHKSVNQAMWLMLTCRHRRRPHHHHPLLQPRRCPPYPHLVHP
jgi:hypothetical protein